MTHALRITFLSLLFLLPGCETLGLVPAKSFTEQVAYADVTAQGLTDTLANSTCRKYTAAGACTEPGRPLHPARSDGYLSSISKARLAIRTAATMPESGGICLGQPSTPVACLALATTLLTEVERILTAAKK